MPRPRSLFDKVWSRHVVRPETIDAPAILAIDLHLVHEVTSPYGFQVLAQRGLPVRRPDRTLATLDHSTPTRTAPSGGPAAFTDRCARIQVQQLRENCARHGIRLLDWDSPERGIVHVAAPELGATHPGSTVVCGDSHTSTHGAFGALAFGIGSSEVGHVLATQCLLQRRPRSMRVRIEGSLGPGVSAKDLALHVIGKIGVDGGTGHVVEYDGSTIGDLDMEGRMTLCNMSIEAGARSGMVAPDEVTVDYLRGRPLAPAAADFDAAAEHWLALAGDEGAAFDHEHCIDARAVVPTVTWGTHPGMTVAIDQPVPLPRDAAERRAQRYMAIAPGRPLAGHPIDVVFIGSCTNGRISDLRRAAAVLRGRRVAAGVRMLVVPGSEAVRRQAEAEGLDRIFAAAGAEWRLSGCSMCIAMNGDQVAPGQTAISTSNRNFEGRQGPGARTLLASPATAAASAVAGCVADPRTLAGTAVDRRRAQQGSSH